MSRIGLIGENSIEYIHTLLDIWNSQDCAVLIDWRIPYQTAIEMMNQACVHKCYIEKKVLDKFQAEKPTDIEMIPFEKKSNSAELLPDDIYHKFKGNYTKREAIVLYSSGTTGKAKGIILTHYAINKNADAIIDYMQPTEKDRIYIAKTISHSSTITGELLVALKTNMKAVIAPTIVLPRVVLNNIEKFHVTIICLNPTLLLLYAEELSFSGFEVNTLRSVYVSGSVLQNKTYEYAKKFFPCPIYNVYGLTEAGPRVTAQRIDCCNKNSVGRPIKNVLIKILDEDKKEVGQYERGIVFIKTQSAYTGYIEGDERNKPFYQGWLNSGDIGYFDEKNELNIVGRYDDLIIINSHKIYPGDLEKKINSIEGVIENKVVKIMNEKGDEVICCAYVGQATPKEIKNELLKNCIYYEIPQFYRCIKSIPKTMNGKYYMNTIKELFVK